MAGLAIKDSWRLCGAKLISNVPWSYNGSESNHSKRSSAYKEKWPQGRKMDSLPVCLAGLRQITAGGGMLWLPPPHPGDLKNQDGCLLFFSPLRLPLTAYHSAETTEITEKHSDRDITTETTSLCVFLWCVEVISPPVWRKDTSSLSHTLLHTIQTSHRGPVLWQGRWKEGKGGGQVFFQAVENGGEFYDPCSLSSCKNHTSRFSSVAASSAAQPMKTMERVEKKQGKQRGGRKKKELLGRKYLQVYFIHIHHPFPSHQALRWNPLPTHTHVEIFKTLRSSHGFSVAIRAGDLPKLSAGTLFCGGGSFGSSPTKMHHGADPPHVGG